MNYKKSHGQKFNLELRPSRYFFTLISGLHLIILTLMCLCDLQWWMFSFIIFIIISSYAHLLWKYIYRKSKYSVICLWQSEEQSDPCAWQIQFSKNNIQDAKMKPKGYLSDYVIIMHFNILRRNKFKIFSLLRYKPVPVIIFPDMIDYKVYVAIKRFLLGY